MYTKLQRLRDSLLSSRIQMFYRSFLFAYSVVSVRIIMPIIRASQTTYVFQRPGRVMNHSVQCYSRQRVAMIQKVKPKEK